jgi:predicted ATPase
LVTRVLRGDLPEDLLVWADECIAVSREQGFPHWLAKATVYRGWALSRQGHHEEGIEQIREGIAGWRAVGAGCAVGWFKYLLSEALTSHGMAQEAFAASDEALESIYQNSENGFESFVYIGRSKALVALQRPDEAEDDMRKAIGLAQSQETKSMELRAATSLARLWQSQSKQREAHNLLAPVYNWFTEGFDTADLKDAKALLEELK